MWKFNSATAVVFLSLQELAERISKIRREKDQLENKLANSEEENQDLRLKLAKQEQDNKALTEQMGIVKQQVTACCFTIYSGVEILQTIECFITTKRIIAEIWLF